MRKDRTETGSEQQCCSEETDEASGPLSRFTTVKTGYARVAILLLAANCAFTGYVVYSLNKGAQLAISPVTTETQTLSTSEGAEGAQETSSPSAGAIQPREKKQ
jgi:hypothetical protein